MRRSKKRPAKGRKKGLIMGGRRNGPTWPRANLPGFILLFEKEKPRYGGRSGLLRFSREPGRIEGYVQPSAAYRGHTPS